MESTPEPNNTLDKEFYRTAEAARILGITQNTLLRWIREGRVSVKHLISGQYRIPRAELERLRGYGEIPACKLEVPAETPIEKPKEEVKDMPKEEEKTVIETETPEPKEKKEKKPEEDKERDKDEQELE
jgi:excisionase family DNA binding protein